MKMHQEKSHVIDVFSNSNFVGNGVGILDGDIYFRNYKDRILIGANDSKTGEDFDGFDHINNFISKKYNTFAAVKSLKSVVFVYKSILKSVSLRVYILLKSVNMYVEKKNYKAFGRGVIFYI